MWKFMSAITQADENLEAAKDNIKSAIKLLTPLAVSDDTVFGAADFTSEYKKVMFKALGNLLEISRELSHD
jgi:hypothetical protein